VSSLYEILDASLCVCAGAAAGGGSWEPDPRASTYRNCDNRTDPVTFSGWWEFRGHSDPLNFWTSWTTISGAAPARKAYYMHDAVTCKQEVKAVTFVHVTDEI